MRRLAWMLWGLSACVAPPLEPTAPPLEAVEAPPLPPAETSSRRVALAIEVPSIPSVLAGLEEALATRGGYLTQRESPEARADGRVVALVSFQVDLRQADALEALLQRTGTRLAERREVADATASIIEGNARQAALRETEARLRALLSNPATTCPERVAAEQEHARVLGEMAELAARLRVLEFRSQYAAFAVRLVEPASPPPTDPGRPALPQRVAAAWTRVKHDPSGALSDGVVAVVASLPWLCGLLVAWWGIRRLRRRRDGGARAERPAA